MFVEIEISNVMKDEAKSRAIKTIEQARGLTPKFQTDELKNKTIGFIGEAVFEKWLKDNSIDFKQENVYGKPDCGDFIVGDKIIEVKTGQMTWAVEQLQPGYKMYIAEQQISEKRDIYVNIQIDNNMKFAYITGFISSEDAGKYNVFQSEKMINPAIGIPLRDLKSMELFNYGYNGGKRYGNS